MERDHAHKAAPTIPGTQQPLSNRQPPLLLLQAGGTTKLFRESPQDPGRMSVCRWSQNQDSWPSHHLDLSKQILNLTVCKQNTGCLWWKGPSAQGWGCWEGEGLCCLGYKLISQQWRAWGNVYQMTNDIFWPSHSPLIINLQSYLHMPNDIRSRPCATALYNRSSPGSTGSGGNLFNRPLLPWQKHYRAAQTREETIYWCPDLETYLKINVKWKKVPNSVYRLYIPLTLQLSEYKRTMIKSKICTSLFFIHWGHSNGGAEVCESRVGSLRPRRLSSGLWS